MKDHRDKEMKNLMYILFFLFLMWCTPILEHIECTEDKSNYTILVAVLESTVISGILSSATLLCDCLVSNRLKDRLVGLFFIPRAGETVFSRIKSQQLKDDRFQDTDAIAVYADIIQQIPTDKKKVETLKTRIGMRYTKSIKKKAQ